MRENFAEAYDEHVGRVYGFFAYRIRSSADAEDLTQQTFERALRAWGRFDPQRAPLGVWLMTIARNLLVDHYRRDRTPAQEPLDAGAEERYGSEIPDPDLGIEPDLARALADLTPREREVLALRFGADLSGPEISELLELSLSNTQQILSRALRRLRAALEPATDRP